MEILNYTEEHNSFRERLKVFLAEEVTPFGDQWEADKIVPKSVWRKMGQGGFLCTDVAAEYGGMGGDFLYSLIVAEEMTKTWITGLATPLHSDIVVPYILEFGSAAQKDKYIPTCVTGDIVTAIAMTEPGTGSDLQGIKTTAVLDGDEYVINGSKTFISNGQQADLIIVAARTDPAGGAAGTSLLLVEATTPGFERGTNLEKVGMKAQDTSELFFSDARVPKANLLGKEGEGFLYLMRELPQERLSIALMCIATAESVLQQTVAYVSERKAFGKPLAAFQNTQFKLAEMDTEVTAARVFIDRCLELHLDGKLDAVDASKAKLLSTELLGRVVDECVQLHGGYGYMWEYPVARAYADARVQRIVGGTSEVMKLIIGRALVTE